jgi:MarR family transcriptional regulator, organic hydroperoxide resistance regulator
VNDHLGEIRSFWGDALGITGPQWTILMVLADLDRGNGVALKTITATMRVDPSFVTTQSKILEKKGLVQRKSSEFDARIVEMSLSDKGKKQFENMMEHRKAVKKFVFAEFNDRDVKVFFDKLTLLKIRLEEACLMASMNLFGSLPSTQSRRTDGYQARRASDED